MMLAIPYTILQQAVSNYQGNDCHFILKVRDVSLVASISGLQSNLGPEDDAERRLENVLDAWKFERVKVAGDGNCLFSAVAMGILQQIHSGHLPPVHFLGLDKNANLTTIIIKLMVHEWNTNDFYQGFVTFDITQLYF